jgi:tetrahydromethanopterin S-methyltransferase subunit D
MSPALASWIVVAVAFIVAEALMVYEVGALPRVAGDRGGTASALER